MNPILNHVLSHLRTARGWIRGLLASIITSAATAGLSLVGTAVVGLTVNVKQLLITCLSAGVVGALSYLKHSPLPPDDHDQGPPVGPGGLSLPLVAVCLLPFLIMGCGSTTKVETAPAPSTGVVADKAEVFWSAMKGDLSKAREFLASPVAKQNAPIFARAVWKLSLAGARAAEVDLAPVAQVGVPVCDVVISLTGSASAVTSAQIDAVLAGTGSHDSLAAYNPFLTLAGPVLDWITEACGDDADLAKFYLRLIAAEGKSALIPFLPGVRVTCGERFIEEWADRIADCRFPISDWQNRRWA